MEAHRQVRTNLEFGRKAFLCIYTIASEATKVHHIEVVLTHHIVSG